MSFFIRQKQKNQPTKNKFISQKRKQGGRQNDELTSSEDDTDQGEVPDQSPDENDYETAQEKKLRLAKIYLKEIEQEEKRRLEDEDTVDGDIVSKRLKEDYLQQTGRWKQSVANQYKGADIKNIKILKCKSHDRTVTCFCISPDCKFIYSGSKNGSVVKWSFSEHTKIASIPFVKRAIVSNPDVINGHSKEITSISLSSDDKFLAVADETSNIQIWNPVDLKHVRSLKGHRDSITGLTFRKGTHTLYSCSKDRTIKVWSLDEMAYVETLFGHQSGITAVDALTRERVVTSGGNDTTLRIWKIAEESQLIFNGHSGNIDTVRLINEENFISGGDDGQICIWSSMKKKPLCSVKDAHGKDPSNSQAYWINSVASLLNTDLVASGSQDGDIRVWKLGEAYRSLELLFKIPICGFINEIQFTSDGQYLIVAVGQEHRFGRWNVIRSAKNGIIIIPLLKDN